MVTKQEQRECFSSTSQRDMFGNNGVSHWMVHLCIQFTYLKKDLSKNFEHSMMWEVFGARCLWRLNNCMFETQRTVSIISISNWGYLKTVDIIKECCITTGTRRKINNTHMKCTVWLYINPSFQGSKGLVIRLNLSATNPLVQLFLTSALRWNKRKSQPSCCR